MNSVFGPIPAYICAQSAAEAEREIDEARGLRLVDEEMRLVPNPDVVVPVMQDCPQNVYVGEARFVSYGEVTH